jgi:hypothetical protein
MWVRTRNGTLYNLAHATAVYACGVHVRIEFADGTRAGDGQGIGVDAEHAGSVELAEQLVAKIENALSLGRTNLLHL